MKAELAPFLIGAYYFDQNIATVGSGQTRVFLSNAGLTVPFLVGGFGLDTATASFVLSQFAPVDPHLEWQLYNIAQY